MIELEPKALLDVLEAEEIAPHDFTGEGHWCGHRPIPKPPIVGADGLVGCETGPQHALAARQLAASVPKFLEWTEGRAA